MFDTCNISHSEFNVWKKELFGLEWRTVDRYAYYEFRLTVCVKFKREPHPKQTDRTFWVVVVVPFFPLPNSLNMQRFRQHYRLVHGIAHLIFFFFTDTFSLHNESLNINTGFESHQSEFWKGMNCFSWTLFNIVYAYCCIYCAFIVCANIVVSLLFANIPLNQSHLFARRVAPRSTQRPSEKKKPDAFAFHFQLHSISLIASISIHWHFALAIVRNFAHFRQRLI